MGYRLNRLDEPVLMEVPKPMQTEFGIHYRLESCAGVSPVWPFFGRKEETFGFHILPVTFENTKFEGGSM